MKTNSRIAIARYTIVIISIVFVSLAFHTRAHSSPPIPSLPTPTPPLTIAPTPTPATGKSSPVSLFSNEGGTIKKKNCQSDAFVLLTASAIEGMHQSIGVIEDFGGCIVHVFPPNILIGAIGEDLAQELLTSGQADALYRTLLTPETLIGYSKLAPFAVMAWNGLIAALPPEPDIRAAHDSTPSPLIGDVLPVPDLAMAVANPAVVTAAAAPGPGYFDTSEFMAGSVALGIIIMESDGSIDFSTEDWSDARIAKVISEISSAVEWWTATNPRGDLSLFYDIHILPTSYEPINHSQRDDKLWGGEAMSLLGYSDAGDWWDQVYAYLNDLRASYGTDWATVAFIVDSDNDLDGRFTDGYFGYTYGFLIVMTYDNNGWGIANMDSVFAHEFAHNFGAADEYCSPGYACCWGGGEHGYLGIPNSNCVAGCDLNGNGICDGDDSDLYTECHRCPSCVETICLMRGGRVTNGVDTISMEQIGVRDRDSDGILDPLDTTPLLTLDIWPPEVVNDNPFTYMGKAEDIPYDAPTYNPDITINHIDQVQFEVDYDGVWRHAFALDGYFDGAVEQFSATLPPLSDGQHNILIAARNSVGNISTYLYDTFVLDTVGPTVNLWVSPMYGDAPFQDFEVGWQGTDEQSGVVSYDIQYRDGVAGLWTDWQTDATEKSGRFVGQDSHTYYFRGRAYDTAGNSRDYTDGSAMYQVQLCPASDDDYESDNDISTAQLMLTDGAYQQHNFHAAADHDWVKFYAAAGVSYTLHTTNEGGHADTILSLFDTDGTTLIAENDDDPDNGLASKIEWQPATDGYYYAMINHWDEFGYGCTTGYSFRIVTDDSSAPRGNILINDDGIYANSSVVAVALAATDIGTGVAEMRISTDGSNWEDWTPYHPVINWQFDGPEGVSELFVQFRDYAGNVSPTYSDSIFLDTTTPTGAILIDDDVAYTGSPDVTLTLTASDLGSGVADMRIAVAESNWGAWEPYMVTKTWHLGDNDGVKALSVQYRDNAGNVSLVSSDSIVLDTTAPTGSIAINGGGAYTNSPDVLLTFTATDTGAGVTAMRIAGSLGVWESWSDFRTEMAWRLDPDEDQQRVYMMMQDGVGNKSQVYYAEVGLDLDVPDSEVSVLPVRSGTEFVVSWFGSDNMSGIAGYDVQFRDGAGEKWIDWQMDTVASQATFTGGDCQLYYFRSRARDLAGNMEAWPSSATGDAHTMTDWCVFLPAILN